MLSHCLKCRKATESKKPKVVTTKNPKNDALFKMCSVQYQKIKIYQRTRS